MKVLHERVAGIDPGLGAGAPGSPDTWQELGASPRPRGAAKKPPRTRVRADAAKPARYATGGL